MVLLLDLVVWGRPFVSFFVLPLFLLFGLLWQRDPLEVWVPFPLFVFVSLPMSPIVFVSTDLVCLEAQPVFVVWSGQVQVLHPFLVLQPDTLGQLLVDVV